MEKKCGCNLITFGQKNLYMLLILLGAVFRAAKEIIASSSDILRKGCANEPEKQHPVIITINYSMGLCLSFIFFIIYKICNKRHKTILIFDKIMNKSASNHEITKKEKFLWILLGSVLDFIANLIYSYNWVKEEEYLCYWPSNLLLMSLFSFLVLKEKLYKHHYLSIIIISIFGIAHNFISGNFNPDKMKANYIGYTIYFFAEGIFNVLYVLYKFLMIKKFIKSYLILFSQGLIELILGIIFLVITTKYYPKLDNFNKYINDVDGKEIGIFISLIFINFITFLTIFIIIDIFTHFHIFLLNILSEIITGFFVNTYNTETYKKITYVFFIIISIFMVLVFIEIIQLNFFGLSTMTKKNIEERAKLDSIVNGDNDDIDDILSIDDNKEQNINLINLEEYTFELKDIYKYIY